MGSSLRDDVGTRLCHSERSETKSKNLLAMCSLSAVCILGDPSATLGMTFIVSIGNNR